LTEHTVLYTLNHILQLYKAHDRFVTTALKPLQKHAKHSVTNSDVYILLII